MVYGLWSMVYRYMVYGLWSMVYRYMSMSLNVCFVSMRDVYVTGWAPGDDL